MALLQLPEEILIKIIKYLDFKSCYSLYNTCCRLKNIVVLRNVIKVCNLSLSTLATGQSFKLKLFGKVAKQLRVLNMKGVPNLNRSLLMPAAKRLKSLMELDISFTLINLKDLMDIFKICPMLKNVSVNFDFGIKRYLKIPQTYLHECQNMFQNFENVHFVLNMNNIYSDTPFYVLEKSKLKTLKFTFTDCYLPKYENILCKETLECTELHVYSLNWMNSLASPIDVPSFAFLEKINQNNYQYFLLSKLDHAFTVVATAIFKDFFKKEFNIETISLSEAMSKPSCIYQNFIFFARNVCSTTFDDMFFSTLVQKVRNFFPHQCQLNETYLPIEYNSFLIQLQPNELEEVPVKPPQKRLRTCPSNVALDFDSVFKSKDKIKLYLEFEGHHINPITLSAHYDYLKKITYLSIKEIPLCSTNFYEILFKCCVNIETFVSKNPRNDLYLWNAISLSKSLKNLYMESFCLHYKKVMFALSKCEPLENVVIIDHSLLSTDLDGLQDLIISTVNLYNINIDAKMSYLNLRKIDQMVNKTKSQCGKTYLNVVLGRDWYYDPFIDVFCLNSIKHNIL